MAVTQVTKALIGEEDLNIGSGTFSRPTSTGGTGSITKIGLATFSNWVNVMDYGAVGDGSTNDYAAITAAIAALPGEGVLFFPAGKTFITSAKIVVDKRCNIVGYGATLKASGTYTGTILQIGTTDTLDRFGQDTVWHGTVDGLIIHGNSVADGIDFVRTNRAQFNNLFITRCKGTAMRFDRANESTWINTTIIDCYDPGDTTPLVDFAFANGSSGDATNNCTFIGQSYVTNGNKVIVNFDSPSDVTNQFATRKLSWYGCLFHGVTTASNALDSNLTVHADLVLTKLGSCSGVNFFDCRWQLADSVGTAIQFGSLSEVDTRTVSGFKEAQNCFMFGGDILESANSGTAIDVGTINGSGGYIATQISGDLTITDAGNDLSMPTSARYKADHTNFTTSKVGLQVENVSATGVTSDESPKIEIKNPNSMQSQQSVAEIGGFRQHRIALSSAGSNPATLVFEDDETTVNLYTTESPELNIGKSGKQVRSLSLTPLAAEPSDKHTGMIVLADGTGWDPLSVGSDHTALWDGAAWRAL